MAAHAGGHIAHVASALGQLDIIAPEGIKSYIRDAKSVQALVDMPYPAEELAKVRFADASCIYAVWPSIADRWT